MTSKANLQLSCPSHPTAPIAANDNFPCRLVSNRTVKTTGSTGEIYIYDPSGKLLEETSQAGVAIADYIYIDNLLVSVWKPSLPQMVSVYGDQLGTPQATTDQYWQIDWKANYQPFGTTSNVVTSGIYTGPITQNLRLPGQYGDAESGFNYNGFRDYAPMLGRYLESDPIGLNGGMNTYGYVGQNPLTGSDPHGLDYLSEGMGALYQGIQSIPGGVASLISDPVETLEGWAPAAGGLVGVAGGGAAAAEEAAAGDGAAELAGADMATTTGQICKPKTVVIGEDMNGRVIPTAQENGADWYQPSPDLSPEQSMQDNQNWINQQMDDGCTILDCGAAPGRANYPDATSEYYQMEQNQIQQRGYQNYQKIPASGE